VSQNRGLVREGDQLKDLLSSAHQRYMRASPQSHQRSSRIRSMVTLFFGSMVVICSIILFASESRFGKTFSFHCSRHTLGPSSATTCNNAVNNSPQYSSSTCAMSSGGAGPNIESNLYKRTCLGSVPSSLSWSKSGCSASTPIIV
jgi:hypothetical protein